MSRVYISDSNIWIDFQHADLLDELFRLPLTLCCTDFVIAELRSMSPAALIERGLQIETLDEQAIFRLFKLMAIHHYNSVADISCYLLAQETGWPLLTGDGRLRKLARQQGVQVHGVLWLLDRLLGHGVISRERAAGALQVMLAHGARLPAADCHARLLVWRG